MTALEFLLNATEKVKIVGSGNLSELQIAEAIADKRFFIDPETMLGWAVLPIHEPVAI